MGHSAVGAEPREGQAQLLVHLWTPLPEEAGDTASFWVVAKLLELPVNHPSGVPLPVFAADSVLRAVDFARLREAPVVDTVRLRLRSSEGQ
jgi:hypothetical protein